MTMRAGWLAALCLGLITAWTGPALAERAKDIGNYVVHYNTVTTDFLTPEVARAYGITRSKNRGLLTVTVLQKNIGIAGRPVTADVSARAINLSNQAKDLDMREVEKANSIYYVGDFSIANQETLDFTVNVSPHDSDVSTTIRFEHQFFAD